MAGKSTPLGVAAAIAAPQHGVVGRLERELRALLREHDLPQPVSNGVVEGYEVDLH